MSPISPISPFAAAIAEALKGCAGHDAAMTAPQLAVWVHRPEREVRKTISEEYLAISRAAGGLLCSKPGIGFFLTTDAEEIAARWRLIQLGKKAWKKQEDDYRTALREFGLAGLVALERKVA